MNTHYVHIGSQLLDFSTPRVMAILNATPDSFVPECRCVTEAQMLAAASLALQQGATILDVGACSTRPNSDPADEVTEWQRLQAALKGIRNAFPQALISLDTFRPTIARQAIEQFGVNMINDVSGGDEAMYALVAEKKIPYILTFSETLSPNEDPLPKALAFFVRRVDILHRLGVADILLDPGFGFGKTVEQNYQLLFNLQQLQVLQLPLLVGISRKSMIYKPLCSSPSEALNGTTALHAMAIHAGASILRVHDVAQANEVITLFTRTNNHYN